VKHWIWNILCALSLLLCVTTVLLWIRSYHVSDHVSLKSISSDGRTKRYCLWESSAGGLSCCIGAFTMLCPFNHDEHEDMRPDHPITWRTDAYPSYPHIPVEGRERLVLGMNWDSENETNPGNYQLWSRTLILPHRWLVLLTALVPVVYSVRRWMGNSGRRQKLGFCKKCGYDLRASKRRCPECGTPFVESPESKP
jgi:hypothetical protein